MHSPSPELQPYVQMHQRTRRWFYWRAAPVLALFLGTPVGVVVANHPEWPALGGVLLACGIGWVGFAALSQYLYRRKDELRRLDHLIRSAPPEIANVQIHREQLDTGEVEYRLHLKRGSEEARLPGYLMYFPDPVPEKLIGSTFRSEVILDPTGRYILVRTSSGLLIGEHVKEASHSAAA